MGEMARAVRMLSMSAARGRSGMEEMDRIASAKRRRWIILVLILALVVALIAWVLYWIDRGGGAFEDALAEARAMGGPVTIHELLEARREWDDDENGALVMELIGERLSTLLEGEEIDELPIVGRAKLPPLGQRWTAELSRAVDAQLQRLSDELASIDTLARSGPRKKQAGTDASACSC